MHPIKTSGKHVPHHHAHHHGNSEKNISFAFFLNLSFTIIEIIGGLLTNSVAILSDAVHDFGDSISLGLAWYFEKLAKKGRDKKYTYGYKRFSLLGAIINSVVLLVGSILILSETVPRIFHPQETNAKGMFLLAILGLIINGAGMLKLRTGHTLNEKVVSLHLLEDVLGWAAILVGSVLIHFLQLPVIDPILSVLITIYILFNVFRNIGAGMRIILQGVPIELDLDSIQDVILQFDDVESMHDLHTWSIDGNYNILTVHVVLKNPLPMAALSMFKKEMRDQLKSQGIHHATIEFETKDEICVFEDCSGNE